MKKIYDIKPPEKAFRKRRNSNKEKQGKTKSFLPAALGVLILISAIVFFFSFRVEINIWPVTEGVELEEEFTVDIAEDDPGESLPGTIFETDFLEEYREFEATGYEDEETRATGTVVVRNEHWGQNQPLVEGTRFETEDGLIFKSTDGFLVPGGTAGDPGEVEVEVEAKEPGPDYNLEEAEFVLPGLEGSPSYEGVTAYLETAITGGAVGERTVVSEEDIENAREEIIEFLIAEGRNILESGKEDEYLMEEDSQYNIEIEEESISAQAGEAAESFEVEIRARVDALTFTRADFRELLVNSILNEFEEVDNNLESEKRVYEDSLSFNYEFTEVDWDEGYGSLRVELAGEVYSGINESRLIERAKGDSRSSVAGFLERQDFVREAEVRFKPFGIGNIPENSDRIRINLNF